MCQWSGIRSRFLPMKYKTDETNKVRRVPERGHYDQKTVFEILDAGYICHVSFTINSRPYIIPTLYGRHSNDVYVHGATTSRLIKNLEKGFPVSLAVTHVDGIVLARSAFHHSLNYRSVVIFGKAQPVAKDQKNEALKIISDQVIPGRWEEARLPSDKELKATSILKITIDQASAKIRSGDPTDEKNDYDLDIWAGVLPVSMKYDNPVDDRLLRAGIPVSPSVKELFR